MSWVCGDHDQVTVQHWDLSCTATLCFLGPFRRTMGFCKVLPHHGFSQYHGTFLPLRLVAYTTPVRLDIDSNRKFCNYSDASQLAAQP